MFESNPDIFLPLLDNTLADMSFIDFLVIESIFLLQNISDRLTGVVVVRLLVANPNS